jgi:hypothetical protein
MSLTSHPPQFDHPKLFYEEYKLWSPLLFNFHRPTLTFSLFGQSILLSTLFSNILYLHASYVLTSGMEGSHVPYPYKTGHITVLYLAENRTRYLQNTTQAARNITLHFSCKCLYDSLIIRDVTFRFIISFTSLSPLVLTLFFRLRQYRTFSCESFRDW